MTPARAALIVASNEYDDSMFSRLRAPVHDAEALARVLRDPEIGGFEVHTLMNEPGYLVREEIEGFFADCHREDLLLLYFSCHGVKDVNGRLYFASRDTKLHRLSATSIASSFVKEHMDQSRSRRIVLLLDCCYSGAFARGLVPRAGQGVDVVERFEGNGRAVITASSAMEYAFEGGDLANVGGTAPSPFTSAVVRGLETGEADRDRDGRVSVDDLYEYVYDEVRRVSPNQTPNMFATFQGALHLARNPRLHRFAQLPPQLRLAMESEFAWQREAAVVSLAALLASGSGGMARSARGALEHLTADDSRRVSEAAGRALTNPPERRIETRQQAVQPVEVERQVAVQTAGDPEAGRAPGRPAVLVTHGDLPIRRVALSPDGARLATAGDDTTARVWDIATGQEVARVAHYRSVGAVAFSPDGARLATAGDDTTARVWEVATGEEIVRVAHRSVVRDVAFSPDGDRLATASDDKTARVWDIAAGQEIFRCQHAGLLNWVLAVAYHPDGDLLATGTVLRTACVWRISTGLEIGRVRCEEGIRDLSFSPDGGRLATASDDATARVWALPTGREVMRVRHAQAVHAVAFHPGGDLLATASNDTTARLWELPTGRELARIPHSAPVGGVAFSDDARLWATGCADGTARVWSVQGARVTT